MALCGENMGLVLDEEVEGALSLHDAEAREGIL